MKHLNINILFALLLFAGNLFAQPEGKMIDKVVAVVGSKPLLYSDLQQQAMQLDDNITLTKEVECNIMEGLLLEKLLLNQAEIDSVEVTEAQVNAELENRIRYFESQVGSIERIEEIFGKSLLEIKEDFYTKIEDRMRVEQVQSKITQDVVVNPKDVRNFYDRTPKDSLPLVNVEVEVAHLVIQPKVTEGQKRKVKEELQTWRDEIVAGKRTFATTAVFESDDPGSKSKGGEFGWVNRGEFVPEFDRVAFNMKEGEISQVFETDYGYHILELFERRGDRYRGRHILRTPKVNSDELYKARNKCDSILDLINSNQLTFEKAVELYSTDDDTKFNKGLIYDSYSTSSKFEIENLDRQLYLAIEGMNPGAVKGPFVMQTNDGKQAYRIIKLLSRSEPHRANLDQDYQLISNIALSEARQQALEKWVNNQLVTTYVKISDEYKDCEYEFNWLTSSPK